MLHERYLSAQEARTSDEFLDQIVRFTKLLGFDTVSATVVIDQPVSESDFIAVSNTPSNYVEVFENSNFARRDPVMQHCTILNAWFRRHQASRSSSPTATRRTTAAFVGRRLPHPPIAPHHRASFSRSQERS